MEKKYIIAVVAVVVLWAAFMGFRYFNKKEESRAHMEDTYRRMIEMAQKSPRSGLHEMAGAIRRYHADNKAYPPDLMNLYPKYMPSKDFIEKIDWDYTPDENNFYLSKSLVYNKKTMVASIDNSMKTELETSGEMVAARKPTRKKKAAVEAQEPEEVQQAISEDMILTVVEERAMTVKEVDVVTAAVSPEVRRGDRPQDAEEKVNVQAELSRIVTLVGAEAVSDQEAQIGYNLERYLVWKDLNGFIGVSNVEFPDRSDMYVAIKNHWYNVKRRESEGATQIAETRATVVEKQKNTEEIAAGFSQNYLVWKSQDGAIGVGNMQYPDKERLVIASRGEWNELERPAVPEAAAAGGTAVEPPAQADIHAIAADISKDYLVWKNTDGSIGIGNTQYPKRERLEVASADGWAVLAEEPPSERGRETAAGRPGDQKSIDEKLLAAGISGQYLMWKDKNGQIGFSNVNYPELRNVAYVHTGGSWQKIVN